MELWVEMQKNEKIKLLYGTGNPAKLDVMRRRMRDLNIEILGLKDFKEKAPDVPEDGNTPLENARQKALAYYDFYGMPVFSCDSGLYLEAVPRELQPGVHVRNVGGKYLTDEEMLAYYAGLAKRYGDLRARYRNAICLVMDRAHVYEAMDDTLASEEFLITAVPCAEVRHKGFPLDSLSVSVRTGKYFYEMDEEQTDELAVWNGFSQFFRRHLPFGRADREQERT
nr:non-canonical purine NTP pyrophosphatase [uncultured Acetatifactor sp.]